MLVLDDDAVVRAGDVLVTLTARKRRLGAIEPRRSPPELTASGYGAA
jgi:hypothetical protein